MANITYDKENILNIFSEHPVFGCLTAAQKQLLVENIHVNKWAKGEMIFTQGSPADYLYLWLDGTAQHFIQTPSGLDVFIAVINRSGRLIGISTILEQPVFIYSLIALNKAKAIRIHKSLLSQIRKENMQFSQELLSSAARSIYRLSLKVEQSATFTASQKVICYVLKHLQPTDNSTNIEMPFRIEKKTLASLLQVTPETLSRTLHYLKELGLHIEKDHVLIENLDSLQRIACSNCSQITIGAEHGCMGRRD
ncbi:MAG: Crp/Fnr family transcriptional regulator [Alphaproteobacteria bacterium]